MKKLPCRIFYRTGISSMKNEIVMKYPVSLYPRNVIRQAIQDYHNICTIRVETFEAETQC